MRVDWAREPKCYICAMGNYKPHHVIILSHFQFHSIHYKTEEPGCRWADKQLVSVRITYQTWGQIMYEVELEILQISSFFPKEMYVFAFHTKKNVKKTYWKWQKMNMYILFLTPLWKYFTIGKFVYLSVLECQINP